MNTMAGATRMPYRRFAALSVVAALSWSIVCLLISLVASAWFGHNPIAAAVTAAAISMLLGVVVDGGTRLIRRVRPRRAPELPADEDAREAEKVPA